jgi:hypothetical protein
MNNNGLISLPGTSWASVVMQTANTALKAVFFAKFGYDLWKIKINTQQLELNRINIREEELQLTTASAEEIGLNAEESKLSEETFSEEKNAERDRLDDQVAQMDEKNAVALKCAVLNAAYWVSIDFVGKHLLEQSAELLLTIVLAIVWNNQPKVLELVFDSGISDFVTKFELTVLPIIQIFAWKIAKYMIKLTRQALALLINLLDSAYLQDLTKDSDDLLCLVKEEARIRNFQELKATVLMREKRVSENRKEKRRVTIIGRQSSAF